VRWTWNGLVGFAHPVGFAPPDRPTMSMELEQPPTMSMELEQPQSASPLFAMGMLKLSASA